MFFRTVAGLCVGVLSGVGVNPPVAGAKRYPQLGEFLAGAEADWIISRPLARRDLRLVSSDSERVTLFYTDSSTSCPGMSLAQYLRAGPELDLRLHKLTHIAVVREADPALRGHRTVTVLAVDGSSLEDWVL